MIGALGNIAFEASDKRIRTFRDFQRKRTVKFAEHLVLDGKPKLQYVGEGLDEISFACAFSVFLGANPTDEIQALEKLNGAPQKLVVGPVVFGDFVVEQVDEDWKRHDGRGRLLDAVVNLTLKEYV